MKESKENETWIVFLRHEWLRFMYEFFFELKRKNKIALFIKDEQGEQGKQTLPELYQSWYVCEGINSCKQLHCNCIKWYIQDWGAHFESEFIL